MYDPATLGPIGDDVVAMYERAEILLISIIRDALLRTGEEPAWDAEQLLAIRQERHRVEGVMGTLHQQLPEMVMQSTDAAYLRGTLEAEKELAEGAKVGMFQAAPGSTPVNHAAVVAIASDTVQRMGKVHPQILRRVEDAFRTIVKEAAGYSVTGVLTTRQAQQRAFTRMARDGMGFFVDKAGRRWGLDTYADMSVRTATTRALLAGHTDTMVANGVDLVVVSSHPRPAPVCAPYERKVLSLTGKFPKGRNAINDQIFNVVATMAEAEAAGLHHPNAVLGGDQIIDTFAGSIGASKGTYRGPAITIRTAQGNRLTVSPEHPVLTGRGWVTAESVRSSDYLFNTNSGNRFTADTLGDSHVDNVPTTVEDEFVALKATGASTLISTTGHNFNDDRDFIEGEIDVVVTDDCLLPVPDTKIIKETGEVFFVRSDVGRISEVCDSAFALRCGGVLGSIGRTLSNRDTCLGQATADSSCGRVEYGGKLLAGHSVGVHSREPFHVDLLVPAFNRCDTSVPESFTYRRPGDSSNPRDVGVAVPGVMEPDYVIDVDRHSFVGHAYDFQTVDGVYSINGIITHNCRHTHSAFVPGFTDLTPPKADVDHKGYEATQKQRYLERQVRASKKMEAAALSEEAKLKARQRTRTYQARIRDHVAEHNLPRYRHREQIKKPAQGLIGLPQVELKRKAEVIDLDES